MQQHRSPLSQKVGEANSPNSNLERVERVNRFPPSLPPPCQLASHPGLAAHGPRPCRRLERRGAGNPRETSCVLPSDQARRKQPRPSVDPGAGARPPPQRSALTPALLHQLPLPPGSFRIIRQFGGRCRRAARPPPAAIPAPAQSWRRNSNTGCTRMGAGASTWRSSTMAPRLRARATTRGCRGSNRSPGRSAI